MLQMWVILAHKSLHRNSSFVSLIPKPLAANLLIQLPLDRPTATLISLGPILMISATLDYCLQNTSSRLAAGQSTSPITRSARAGAAGKTKKRLTLQPAPENRGAKYLARSVFCTTRSRRT